MNLTLTLRKKITARIAYLNHIFGSEFFRPVRITLPQSEQLPSDPLTEKCCSQAKGLVWIFADACEKRCRENFTSTLPTRVKKFTLASQITESVITLTFLNTQNKSAMVVKVASWENHQWTNEGSPPTSFFFGIWTTPFGKMNYYRSCRKIPPKHLRRTM